MKKTTLLVLAMLASQAHAQDILQTLLGSSPTKKALTSGTATNAVPEEVGATSTKTTVSGKTCQDLNIDDQKSLPLKVVKSLIQSEPQQLTIVHDPKTGILKVTSPDMIGNCNSMIEWKVNQAQVEGENTYLVEARIKHGTDCKNKKCDYKVTKVKNSYDMSHENLPYEPNLNGFKQCLKESGAFNPKGDGLDKNGIYYAPINERISDVKETGKVLFVSEGPVSSLIGPVYGDKFKIVSDCKYYEEVGPTPQLVLSEADETKRQLRAQADELEKCTVEEYHNVADFLSKNSEFEAQLKDVRDRLIKEATQKSAAAILEGKSTDEDMRVLADFEKYIIEPKKQQALALYAELEDLKPGVEREAKLKELRQVLKELAAYANKPYLEAAHMEKLLADGMFDQAEKVFNARLNVVEHLKLGATLDGKFVTAEAVETSISEQQEKFSDDLEDVKHKYEIRTGQVSGYAKAFTDKANAARRHKAIMMQNHMEAIADEQKRMQPGGYCTAYFRNYQKCAAQSAEEIQRIQFIMGKKAEKFDKLAIEYDQKAAEYAKLEKDGKDYLANRGVAVASGEESSSEEDDLKAPKRDESSYTFDYNPQAAQTGQWPPQQQQPGFYPQAGLYPQAMPYQQSMFAQQNPFYPQQSPFMGQSGGFGQFGFQANFGQQQPYMGLQQPMFGQQFMQPQYAWGAPAMNQFPMPYQQQPMWP